jgi:hypothetical protein
VIVLAMMGFVPGGLRAQEESVFPPRTRVGTLAGLAESIWHPAPGMSWQYQLLGNVDPRVSADVFVVDLFDTSAATVRAIRLRGGTTPRRVVCYISAGTYENWRPDAFRYPSKVKGDFNGWPGEQWLDIRALDVLGPLLERRLDLCQEKGFDGVEFDNVDGWRNKTGFALNAGDQLRFNRYLATAARRRGLAAGAGSGSGTVFRLRDQRVVLSIRRVRAAPALHRSGQGGLPRRI